MSEATMELIKSIIPSIITATVAVIALISAAISSKKATQTSYNNNIDNMRFVQKEKISDQFIERSSVFLTKTDPNKLNTKINTLVPREITESEFSHEQEKLLSITDDIQTTATIIKMLLYSVRDEENEALVNTIFTQMDQVHSEIQDMLLELNQLYLAMTPNGNIKNIEITPEKYKLEKSFSESYPKLYAQLAANMIKLTKALKESSIPH